LCVGVGIMCHTSYMENFVKEFYTKLDILEPHQLDYKEISYKLGIKIFYWYEPSQALFLKQHSYIFLNAHLSKVQKWQDFCHELGHVLLHAGNQRRLSAEFVKYQEAKANLFMYHACVPSFMLDQLEINDYTSETINLVAGLFCVEGPFAARRLEQYINNKLHRMCEFKSSNQYEIS